LLKQSVPPEDFAEATFIEISRNEKPGEADSVFGPVEIERDGSQMLKRKDPHPDLIDTLLDALL
jgi:hypothetical protein